MQQDVFKAIKVDKDFSLRSTSAMDRYLDLIQFKELVEKSISLTFHFVSVA